MKEDLKVFVKQMLLYWNVPSIISFSSLCSALVWGSSVKHNPQKVGKDHVLEDEDVIQLVKK